MSNLEFLNVPKSPTYRRIYGKKVNTSLLNRSPYQFKHEDRYKRVDRFKRPTFTRTLPLRPVNVLDYPPHPSKDIVVLYEYYFPESAADHKTPSVAEMSFIQRKLDEKEMENTKTQKGKNRDWSEETNDEENPALKGEPSHHLPPLNSRSPARMESTGISTYSSQLDGTTTPLPFISVSESKDHRMLRKEWEDMTPGQKKTYADYVEPTGKDWRDDIRDRVWLTTLERIDERVKNNNADLHMAEVRMNAQALYEDRLNEMIMVQQEKDARQKVAQQNRLTPTQIRKLAVIATKEWKKFDFEKKKQAKEKRRASEQRKREQEVYETEPAEESENS